MKYSWILPWTLAFFIGLTAGIVMMYSLTVTKMEEISKRQKDCRYQIPCREHFKACAACADMIEADGGIR